MKPICDNVTVRLTGMDEMIKWQPIETAPKTGRALFYSPIYKSGDPMRFRLADCQFSHLLKEATHWAELKEPSSEVKL